MKSVGQWVKANGKAIYGTEASPFALRLSRGRVTRKTAVDKITLYHHIRDWPEDGKPLLPALKETPVSGRVLTTGQEITSSATGDGLLASPPAAKTWQVEAGIIASAAVELLVKSGKKASKVQLAATGNDKTCKTVPLGTIALPAGQTSFEFKGVSQGWKPIQLRRMKLKPAR